MNKIKNLNETVLDLFIGIFIYCTIFQIIGLILVEDKWVYSIALWIGGFCMAGVAAHMYLTLDTALSMQPSEAIKYTRKKSIIRTVVILIIGFGAIYYSGTAFVGTMIGFFGLKIAAYCQPIVNSHITKKIKKGRR